MPHVALLSSIPDRNLSSLRRNGRTCAVQCHRNSPRGSRAPASSTRDPEAARDHRVGVAAADLIDIKARPATARHPQMGVTELVTKSRSASGLSLMG